MEEQVLACDMDLSFVCEGDEISLTLRTKDDRVVTVDGLTVTWMEEYPLICGRCIHAKRPLRGYEGWYQPFDIMHYYNDATKDSCVIKELDLMPI